MATLNILDAVIQVVCGLWSAVVLVGLILSFRFDWAVWARVLLLSLSLLLVAPLFGFRYGFFLDKLDHVIITRQARQKKSVCWRSFTCKGHPVLSPVMDQGMRPICSAYAIKAYLESKHRIEKGEDVEIPISEIVNACKVPGRPCGLNLEQALKLLTNVGICCLRNGEAVQFKLNEISIVMNENEITKALYRSPVPCTIIPTEALHDPTKKGEVYRVTKAERVRFIKQEKPLYHDVVIVGMGDVDGVPVWLAQNSWGKGYRDNGFFFFVRKSGIKKHEVSPLVEAVFVKDFEMVRQHKLLGKMFKWASWR